MEGQRKGRHSQEYSTRSVNSLIILAIAVHELEGNGKSKRCGAVFRSQGGGNEEALSEGQSPFQALGIERGYVYFQSDLVACKRRSKSAAAGR